MEDAFLSDCWALYFHDPDNDQWDIHSYQRLQTISSVQDWIQSDFAFQELWQHGMFFLMREHVLPMWEDDHNRNGGCLSFKVNKPDAKEYWFQLGCKTLGEALAKGKGIIGDDHVCGVSISPKRNYCILRVWLHSTKNTAPEWYHLETPHYTQVLFKPHAKQKDYDTVVS